MKTAPDDITNAKLDCIVMPNGEVLCLGRTIGWVKTLGSQLTPYTPTPATKARKVAGTTFLTPDERRRWDSLMTRFRAVPHVAKALADMRLGHDAPWT